MYVLRTIETLKLAILWDKKGSNPGGKAWKTQYMDKLAAAQPDIAKMVEQLADVEGQLCYCFPVVLLMSFQGKNTRCSKA